MKRVSIFAVVILTLFSCVIAEAAPSLLPFSPDWTPTEIRNLVSAGANVNEQVLPGLSWTPLMHAAKKTDNPEVIRALIEMGAKVNASDEFGYAPLNLAAASNTPKIVKVLVEAGADVNARTKRGSQTPLMAAAGSSQHPEVIRLLVEAGSDVNAQDNHGLKPWMIAMRNENAKVYQAVFNVMPPDTVAFLLPFDPQWTTSEVCDLIEAGAEVNERDALGRTVLMYAARLSKDAEVIKYLITSGADADARDTDGWTPLAYATIYENIVIIKTLIASGASVNSRSAIGCTPLMEAAKRNKSLEAIRLLIEAGAQVNVKDTGGMTPLMHAAKKTDNPEVIKLLLTCGADGTYKSSRGKTAFDYAKDNPTVKDTEVYWLLNDARF